MGGKLPQRPKLTQDQLDKIQAEREAKRPHLTQAQLDKMKADRAAKRQAMEARRSQMKGLNDQLRAEMQKKPADKDKIAALMKQIDIQRQTMRIQQMETMIKNRPDMKPADQQRYNDMIQKAKDRLAKRQQAK